MNLQSILKPISLRPVMLKRVVLGGGAVAFGLYRLLYATGIDGRGLLKGGHFAWVLLCILSVAMGAVIFASASQLRGGDVRFRKSLPAAVCCGLALVSTVFTGLSDLWGGYLIYAVPAFLAACAFAAVTLCRLRGRKPNFGMHSLICIHFTLQLLKLYQANSFHPQFQDYIFQILACVALAVTGYQLAATDLGRGSRRWLWTAGMAAVYLCTLSLGSSATGIFLTGGAWAFTALMVPMRKREPVEG